MILNHKSLSQNPIAWELVKQCPELRFLLLRMQGAGNIWKDRNFSVQLDYNFQFNYFTLKVLCNPVGAIMAKIDCNDKAKFTIPHHHYDNHGTLSVDWARSNKNLKHTEAYDAICYIQDQLPVPDWRGRI